ncbi:hypothetical protein [Hydrogenophaga sp. PBL-H3]|uniref:hypothetical protein n=1 Tax=Hydrogenophaga sp. PBL-H3 TaxID=434010 RepID=UPI001320295C|nr:hypothetical protein [Hydrogenophaga sp. PBL-H3]QHE74536.1 hypothetical protein F9Z45_00025 [Hydrogenophaga sp. PBL-H3]QHE78961.1 hypothetical protein F9Z44_00025 [Hydrogenophaga sp. PBL-H3]
MATEKSISFRSNLESNSLDLIRKVGWNCARTSELIAGMVSQLAAYTEEGVPMSPSVFICSSVSHLVQLAGVGEHIPLSADVPLELAGAKILKDAAPLCFGQWRIFVERSTDGQRCNYGVFCGTSDPSSLTIDEVVLDAYDESFPVIRISQSATNKVEVRSNAGDGIEFRFNNDRDTEEIKVHQHVRQLAEAISSKSGRHSDLFAGYIDRVLSIAIKDCHGTLIAVVPSVGGGLPEEISDLVRLEPPFYLYDRFQRHVDEGKTASSVSRLQAASELVSGFIDSDGITVFNDAGYVLGYRAFIKSDNTGAPVTGGARSRAFGSMKAMVGKSLSAAFFRSQDGRTDFLQAEVEQAK